MTKSDELIETLVSDLSPLSPDAFRNRVIFVAVLGIAGAVLALTSTFYFRSGVHMVSASAFLVKFGFSAGTMLTLIVAQADVARPGAKIKNHAAIVLALFTVMVLLAVAQLAVSPRTAYSGLIFGYSALICPFLIAAFGVPAFCLNFWFLRHAAPTRPRLAGFIAGACAGAIGAWVYSLACTENGFAFITIWYSLAIALSGFMGALCGPAWLRW